MDKRQEQVEEYKALRAEILARQGFRTTTMQWTTAALALILSALVSMDAPASQPGAVLLAIVGAHALLLFALLGTTDHGRAIAIIGTYLRDRVETPEGGFGWEREVSGDGVAKVSRSKTEAKCYGAAAVFFAAIPFVILSNLPLSDFLAQTSLSALVAADTLLLLGDLAACARLWLVSRRPPLPMQLGAGDSERQLPPPAT